MADRNSADTANWLRPPQPIRASDADRHATVLVLQDATARGLLTPDEGSDRMAAAFAAVYLLDLEPLTTDLPPARARQVDPPGWQVLFAVAAEQCRSLFRDSRTGRYSRRRIAVAALVAALLIIAVGTAAIEVLDGGGPRPGPTGFGRR